MKREIKGQIILKKTTTIMTPEFVIEIEDRRQ